MINICGKPILQWQIESLKAQGVTDYLIIVGYYSEIIMAHFGDGSRFGAHIEYYVEKEPMGTADALFKIELPNEFLYVNGDLIFDFTLKDMMTFHQKKKADITLFTHPSSHPFDSMIVHTDSFDKVLSMQRGIAAKKTFSNLGYAGICVIKKKAVFLDRDGTVNRYKGYISSPEQVELIPGAARAINTFTD